ncbi:MAG: FAD-binding oxidoreductase [Thermoplasmata archaeon]
MSNSAYILWGREGETEDGDYALVALISRKMGLSSTEEIWSGFADHEGLSASSELDEILGRYVAKERVSFDPEIRIKHSIGMGGVDYARILDGGKIRIVDAVIFPNEEETAKILRSREKDIEILVYGGGTTVTGGVSPPGRRKYSVSLDTSNLNFLRVDLENLVMEVGGGVTGPRAEEEASKFGLTLGNFPESFYYSTVGGWISTNAAGQESNRYGKTRDMVIAVRMETPIGRFEDRVTPGESAFFKVSDLAVGSEGNFGVVTRAWMRLNPKPSKLYFRAYIFPSFHEGLLSLRKRFSSGVSPIISRLSDDVETSLYLAAAGDSMAVRLFRKYVSGRMHGKEGSLLVVVSDKKEHLHFEGGVSIGSLPAKYWYRERYSRPFMYNRMLKTGIVAETIETSAKWSQLGEIYDSTKKVFDETISSMGIKALLMCHSSHQYLTGSVLYFTFLFYAEDNREEKLYAIRDALLRNIITRGGSISHHHGIGTIHSKFLAEYKGNALSIIREIKRYLDPDRILGVGLP